MKILVTGAAGFIGRHLVRRLSGDGHEVVSLDRRIEPDPRGRFTIRLPVQKLADVPWLDGLHGVQQIYHLACPASPKHYMADPIGTLDTAFNGTKAVLDVAKATGAKVLLASSSEIYGDPAVSPQHEGYRGCVNSHGPRACYDEGKRAAEALAWAYLQEHTIHVKIARIFNTYGPGMGREDGRVVSTFIDQALRGVPLTIHGTGAQTRSLCYVDDLVEGLVRLMADKAYWAPVNLGNPEEISIRDLAGEIIRLTGSGSGIQLVDAMPDDPARRCPDIRRAQSLLDWTPKVTREEGLKRTIEWWRTQ